eukprot:scaffold3.g6233.t1
MFSTKSLKRAAKAAYSIIGDSSTPADAVPDQDGDVFHESAEAHLHPDASEDGGLACNDTQLLQRQRSAIMQVVKTLGKNLLAGNLDLLKVSLPVLMCEPRSYLQKLTDPWVYPGFLRAAAATSDPLERLRWVVTFIVAGLHRAFLHFEKARLCGKKGSGEDHRSAPGHAGRPPFNPILGETFQAFLPDGSRIWLEQVSHHPPVSAFELDGPDGAYVFRGLSEPTVSYKTSGGLSIKTVALGFRSLSFPDGTVIDITYPSYYIRGLLLNSGPWAEISGKATFLDRRHGLSATITFGPVDGTSSSLLRRPDAFSGTVVWEHHMPRSASSPVALDGEQGRAASFGSSSSAASIARRSASGGLASLVRSSLSLRPSKSKGAPAPGDGAEAAEPAECVHVASCSGNWLSHLDWDGERSWTLAEDAYEEWQPVDDPLPSDSRYREDLSALAAGDVQQAQRAKDALEQRQRADAKLRKEARAGGGGG